MKPAELAITILLMAWSFVIIYFYCEWGEMVTHQFNVFHEVLNQCNWYSFPLDLQRMLVTFMSGTQQPALIRGYANIECTRDAFKNVNERKTIAKATGMVCLFMIFFYFRPFMGDFRISWRFVK